jgi:hypothetical protein
MCDIIPIYPMATNTALAMLREERDNLSKAILSLQRMANVTGPKKKQAKKAK